MSLSCSQVSSLMTFYINNKLNYPVKEMFEEHLKNCPKCYEKYIALVEIMTKLSEAKDYINNIKYEHTIENQDQEKDYVLVQSLSAYSDNELSEEESLRVKKYIITNLSARKTLEDFCSIKKILNDSFKKSSNRFKMDFSKNVMRELDLKGEYYKGGSQLKVASIFIFLVTSLTVGLIYVVSSMLI